MTKIKTNNLNRIQNITNDLLPIIKDKYKKIKVMGGKYNFNNACYVNSTHYADNKNNIVLCYCYSHYEKCVFIHCINCYNINEIDYYYDNTFGNLTKKYDYYFIEKAKTMNWKKNEIRINQLYSDLLEGCGYSFESDL